jgi:hypothetical protein
LDNSALQIFKKSPRFPYIHPRLAAIEHTGKDGGPIRVTDAREQLAHLIALEAGADGTGQGPSKSH